MAYQKETRIRPDTPQDNWTVVHRLRSYGDVAYNVAYADFLHDVIEATGLTSAVTAEDGLLYARFDFARITGETALRQTTRSLQTGISRLALQGEVATAIERTSLVSQEWTIATSFQYFHDVTPEAERYLDEAGQHAQAAIDFSQELEHLLAS